MDDIRTDGETTSGCVPICYVRMQTFHFVPLVEQKDDNVSSVGVTSSTRCSETRTAHPLKTTANYREGLKRYSSTSAAIVLHKMTYPTSRLSRFVHFVTMHVHYPGNEKKKKSKSRTIALPQYFTVSAREYSR